MRRALSVLVVGLLSASMVMAVPSVAQASVVVNTPPVAPIPTLPSQTNAALTGSKLADNTTVRTVQIWKAILATRPTGPAVPGPAPAVPVAKPITPLATLTRGAAGGPLVAAFTGGFAIGQSGLQIYGAITGNDPLGNICGSGFEGVGAVMYMGMMPDCTVQVDVPNADTAQQVLTYGSARVTFRGTVRPPNFTYDASCWNGTVTLPSGYTFAFFLPGTNTIGGTTSLGAVGTSTNAVQKACRELTASHWSAAAAAGGDPRRLAVVQSSNPSQPVASMQQQTADPSRTPSCKVNWDDGTTTTGTGTAYKESEGFPISTDKTGCKSAWDAKPGAGIDTLPDRIALESDDGSGSKTQIAEGDVPDMSPEQKKSLTADNGTGLVLERVINGTITSCNTWAADCAQWWTHTGQGTNEGTGDQTYRCSFGGQKVSIAECGPYRHSFDQQTATPTITDPQTGEQVDWQAGTNPQNSTNPGSGPQPGDDCLQSWPSIANPIAWVMHPVYCALIKAFVPRPAVVAAQLKLLQDTWQETFLGEVVLTVTTWSFRTPTGCSGIMIPLSTIWPEADDISFLNACPGTPLSPFAATSTVFLAITFPLGAIFAITRAFGGVIGYGGIGGRGDN
jgi:hypothetical protein